MDSRPGTIAVRTIALIGLVFMVLPAIAIFPFAFNSAEYLSFPSGDLSTRWFESYFSDPSWIRSTLRSFQVAAGSTVLAVLVGTASAVALVRRRVRWSDTLSTVLVFPIVAPRVVLALGMFGFFSTLGIVSTLPGMVVAHSLLGVPFVFVNVAARLGTFDMRLEMAAQSLGASPLRTFLSVTEPIVRPAVISGAFFAFLTSWDEYIIASFMAGVGNQTLPIRIFAGIRFEVDPTNAAVAVLLVSLSGLAGCTYAVARRWAVRTGRAGGDVRI